MIFKALEVPIFLRHILFVGNCEASDAIDAIYHYAGKRIIVELDNSARGQCITQGGDCFVWVKDLDECSTFMHEMTHAATGIMRICGIPLNDCTDELQAYLIGWLKLELLDPVYEEHAKAK